MKLKDLELSCYNYLDEASLRNISQFLRTGLMSIETVHVKVVGTTIDRLKEILKGISGITFSEEKDQVDISISVERESQFKTILNKIRTSEGNIVSVNK